MIIFYIKMKIRGAGGTLWQQGGALGQQGAPPLLFLFMGNTKSVIPKKKINIKQLWIIYMTFSK